MDTISAGYMDTAGGRGSRSERKQLAWSIYIIIGLSATFTRVQMGSVGIMATELMDELGLTNIDLAIFMSAYTLAYMWMQVPMGYLNDKIGTKKVVVGGMTICLIGSLMFSFSSNYEVMKAARFIMGFGGAMAFGSITKSAAVWFDKSMFQTLTGLFSFFLNFGSILAAGPLAFFIGISGWRSAYIGLSVIMAVLLVLSIFILKEPKDYPKEYFEEVKLASKSSDSKKGLKGIFTFQYSILCFLTALITASELCFLFLWATPYLENAVGYSNQIAANITMVNSVGVVVAALTAGFYNRLFKSNKMMLVLTSLLYCLGMLGMVAFQSSIILISIMYFITGYTGNVFFVLMLGIARDGLSLKNLGFGLTTFNFINQFALMAVTFIAAIFIDSSFVVTFFASGYTSVPVLFAFFGFISIIIIMFRNFEPNKKS